MTSVAVVMSNSLLPLNDTDYWCLRYVMGITLPMIFIADGLYSVLTRHSYTVWSLARHLRVVPVQGEQAVLMGVAYLGVAIALFANCYMQYHEKMGFYSLWILALGALLAGGGELWCSWIFLVR